MPLVHHFKEKEGEIIHWEIEETLEALLNSGAQFGIELQVPDYIEARKKQILVMRILHKIIAPGTRIKYESYGKPFLEPEGFISFSHSRNHVVVYKSIHPCGIDLEQLNERVLRIRHKYLNATEQRYLETESIDDLIRLWSAKEAMFKVYGKDGVYLRNNICVDNLTSSSCSAILEDKDFRIARTIRFRIIEDMVLAWTETV
jgi:phosphopantetheinyl transferase